MPNTKQKLLQAATEAMLRQGFAATSVDRICADAGVTKGSFFHYFGSKEGMVQEALEEFSRETNRRLRQASPSAQFDDPLDRVERHLDSAIVVSKESEGTAVCLLGMMAQELAETNDAVRGACAEHFRVLTAPLSQLLSEAKGAHAPEVDFDSDEMSWMFFSLIQGSSLVAKTTRNHSHFVANIEHFRSYLRFLFGRSIRVDSPQNV